MYKDDGTTIGGVVMMLACFACLIAGYSIRDQGFKIQFSVPAQYRQLNR